MKIKNMLPRPAMIVAVVALIAALGGSAYAAAKIGTNDIQNNAITARQVENGTLKGKDFKKGGLTSSDFRDGKLKIEDFSPETIKALEPRWLLLNENGQIEEQSGGFTVIDAYATNDNVYVDSGATMVGHGITATVALQNKLEIDAMPGADPSFNGQVSVARCQTAAVECAPAGAKNENAFVVSPRQDDGTATTTANRERVYVEITP
ncbi:MAG: hypothetical protein ABIZ50_04125 [Solirubrobacterales bacterium]